MYGAPFSHFFLLSVFDNWLLVEINPTLTCSLKNRSAAQLSGVYAPISADYVDYALTHADYIENGRRAGSFNYNIHLIIFFHVERAKKRA
jgi:hypothetical protein